VSAALTSKATPTGLDAGAVATALARLAALAAGHDRTADGAFPMASWAALVAAGVPGATTRGVPAAEELGVVCRVARADLSVGRILDGHLNAVQRLAVQVDPALAADELAGVRAGTLRLGVWGADPGPGEGDPAELDTLGAAPKLHGAKVFCSGAGGLQRAFILVRGPGETAPARMAYVDLTGPTTSVDRTWFAGAGMRGSASHRVVFDGAPVLWLAPEPGALLAEPWFSGDAVRTAASWAGGAHAAAADALAVLRAKGAPGDLEALAAGRIVTATGTIDLWLAEAARRIDAGTLERAWVAHLRDAVDGAIRAVLDEASRACGSRPFATGSPLERMRRDLQTYVLQHRLDPIVARAGRGAIEGA
jgi:hypothetical protein